MIMTSNKNNFDTIDPSELFNTAFFNNTKT